MNGVQIDEYGHLLVGYEFAGAFGVSRSVFGKLTTSQDCETMTIGGKRLAYYNTLPDRIKSVLPSEQEIIKQFSEADFIEGVKREEDGQNARLLFIEIEKAFPGLSHAKILEYSRAAAMLSYIIESRHNNGTHIGFINACYTAFSQVFPGKYTLASFKKILSRAGKEGVISSVVDSRMGNKRPVKYGPEHCYLAEYILSHNRAFCLPLAYQKFCEACQIEGYETPCYRWFQGYFSDNRTQIERNRLGESKYLQKSGYYAKILPAQYVGDQWQLDGWDLPIYCTGVDADGRKTYFCRLVLIAVLDACSRKIIGFCVHSSERTSGILGALENAVVNTGFLPFEIVLDNHSFNKTKEAANFKEKTEKYGVHWTVDSNPRRKSLLERSFRTLGDGFFKDRYGYIGQGIKSRIENGITQQELRDIYTKPENMLTFEQVTLIACDVVKAYNDTVRPVLGVSPNVKYQTSETPHALRINEYQQVSLFRESYEYTVRHGQITISRGGLFRQGFQLSARDACIYEGATVAVRWFDSGKIFAFDPETDKGLFSAKQVPTIHGALANQTEEDRKKLFHNAGRIKGRNAAMRKRKEDLTEKAISLNPNLYETANRVTTPKDVIKRAEQDYLLREMYEQQVSLNRGELSDAFPAELPKVKEMLDKSLQPKEKSERHPFSGHSGGIRVIDKTTR